jgi:hypothetical protein
MSWQDQAIPILRILINDNDCGDYEFSDNRLIETLLAAAFIINNELNFKTNYVISMITQDITPNPVDDSVFMNFMILKAACIIDVGQMRIAAMTAGLEAKCGPATMKTLHRMAGFGTLIDKGTCATLEEMKFEYMFGNWEWCKGILSPFVNRDFFPADSKRTHHRT